MFVHNTVIQDATISENIWIQQVILNYLKVPFLFPEFKILTRFFGQKNELLRPEIDGESTRFLFRYAI